MRDEVLGAVLAGGLSTRFGSPKALAMIGGQTVLRRVADAVGEVAGSVVVVANDPSLADGSGLRVVPDAVAGEGPLGGILTALRTAEAEGMRGALSVACDLPFVSAPLLRLLLDDPDRQVVVPESTGRRGFEPLCAYYPVAALPGVETALREGERAPHRLLERVPHRRIPLDAVRAIGDPEVLFLNLNTREDLARAQRIAVG
jgi:molybdopterin-guanine dinucleotide biosynthesis protein A